MPLHIDADVVTELTWDYVQRRPQLKRLYEKGKTSQWNATTDIDWDRPVNFGEARPAEEQAQVDMLRQMFGVDDGPLSHLDTDGMARFGWEMQAWMVSQFMHGEQGALVATARLVETVPEIDAKYYAANQVNDEARHVEVYAEYLNNKLGVTYPISEPLEALLVDIMGEKRWDITYLGMQIMVEGLALAAFGLGNVMFQDDVIKQITEYVMRDEARHVAFGVLSLQGLSEQMSSAELADREEFLLDATQLMHDRFLLDQVWERMGVDVEEGKEFARHNPLMMVFRQMLFSKIVPNLNKLGFLTPRLRTMYEDLNLIQWEHAPDSATELDPSLTAA